MNRAIFPASNPPAEDGEYLVYWDGVEKPSLGCYDVDSDSWWLPHDSQVIDSSAADYWEELPEFEQSLVIGVTA